MRRIRQLGRWGMIPSLDAGASQWMSLCLNIAQSSVGQYLHISYQHIFCEDWCVLSFETPLIQFQILLPCGFWVSWDLTFFLSSPRPPPFWGRSTEKTTRDSKLYLTVKFVLKNDSRYPRDFMRCLVLDPEGLSSFFQVAFFGPGVENTISSLGTQKRVPDP